MYFIFHHNDNDGLTAGAIAYNALKDHTDDEIKCIEMTYEKSFLEHSDEIQPDDFIYILDLSFTDPTINELKVLSSKVICPAEQVIWIDHHISSIECAKKHPFTDKIKTILDNTRCGSYLTYQFFCPNRPMPDYIQYVDDYDRFVFALDDTEYFKLGFDLFERGPNSHIQKALFENSYSVDDIIKKGMSIKDYITIDNRFYFETFGYYSTIEFDGETIDAAVVNKKSNSWIFGSAYDEYPLCVSFVFNGEYYVYSLYSNKKFTDIDCSKIAEEFGGGGHKGAAGFKSIDLVFKKKGELQ